LKKVSTEAKFSPQTEAEISALADELGLCRGTVEILYGRGVDSRDKITSFLHPDKGKFLDPFLMKGMREAVNLITRAREEGWSVVVYGDYDADGICASSIMYKVLSDFGVECNVFVPERKDGYGLSVAAIDRIFEEYFPQLFITVDCGISNAEEVEYLKEQGAEVIITDHHELPARLPDCICIDPKIEDDYPYDNLCGAGVAFKVGCALNGKSAYAYLDYAAIATVADSVPLTGENRSIVAEGLNAINSKPKKNYSGFYKSGEKVTAQTLAFSVAPKINAAGRMGDSNAALRLFLSADETEIYDYTVKLSLYNTERQRYCDELYLSAKNKLKEKGVRGRVIVLWDESWNSGFVGIVAARLAEEYCRPALLFVKNGNLLKGSARSVDGVNIFLALKSCADCIEEFGGHSQAAGVNVSEEKLADLEEGLDKYLHENYSADSFTPTYYINGYFDGELDRKFVKELELLEPCGVGNRKPLFAAECSSCAAQPIKFGSAHLSVKLGSLDLIWFSGARFSKLLRSNVKKTIIFEYSVSSFRGKEQIKAYLRDAVYQDVGDVGAELAVNAISTLSRTAVDCVEEQISLKKAQEEIDNRSEFGIAFIASTPKTLQYYNTGDLEINIFNLSCGSLADVLIISPMKDCDLSAYEKVVFLDDPVKITLPSLKGKKVFICKEPDGMRAFKRLNTDRAQLLTFFKCLSANVYAIKGSDAEEAAVLNDFGVTCAQAEFSLRVFEQLNLISFESGRLMVYRGIKTNLENSSLYGLICSLK